MLKRLLKRRFTLNSNVFSMSFIVVLLLVMIIFMCQTTVSPRFSIDNPKVSHPKNMPNADREDAMIVAIQRDGSIFFNTEKVSVHMLSTILRERVMTSYEKKIYIKADARTKYGNVNDVLDSIRASGIENIAFLVEQRKPVMHP